LQDRATILNNGSLVIVATRLEDTGEYECIASNDEGSVYAAAVVTVRVSPCLVKFAHYVEIS